MICDFCQSDAADEPLYAVPGSPRGMGVWLCNSCGLLQSAPTKATAGERLVSTSCDANWGNIRHGKGLRLTASIPLLDACVPWERMHSVLDIGSNRGDFVRWMYEHRRSLQITAVEPDPSVVDTYRSIPGLRLLVDRFESISFPNGSFDFVYCSHTLEHADSARAMLLRIGLCLKDSGYLFLEVPNVDALSAEDCVEEFFIDKHRFHFNRALLGTFLSHMGLRVVHGADDVDKFNITFVATKHSGLSRDVFRPALSELPAMTRVLVDEYARSLAINRGRLSEVAKKLVSFCRRQKVAYWGAARLLDALVRYGGLDLTPSWGVVDEYLWKLLPSVHGVKIRRPEDLKVNPPDVVVVLARSSAAEIVAKARSLGVRKTIIFGELLQEAA